MSPLTNHLLDLDVWCYCLMCLVYVWCLVLVLVLLFGVTPVLLVRGFRDLEGGASVGEVPPHLPGVQRRHTGHRLRGPLRPHVSCPQLGIVPSGDANLVCWCRYGDDVSRSRLVVLFCAVYFSV